VRPRWAGLFLIFFLFYFIFLLFYCFSDLGFELAKLV
jgi:cell division protein FtsB